MSFKFMLENGEDGLTYASFLQKFIRAGKTAEAFYIARMYFPRYRKYLAKRLRQHLPEEIGLANLALYPTVLDLCDQLMREEGDKGLEALQAIIYLLCKSPKNKWTDLAWIWHKFNPEIREGDVKDIWSCRTAQDFVSLFISTFDDIRQTTEIIHSIGFFNNIPLMSYIADALATNAQSQSCKGLGCWLYFAAQIAEKNIETVDRIDLSQVNIHIEEIHQMPDIPSYFYDVHTAKGRSLGRDQRHWFQYCCRVDHYLELPGDFLFDPLRDGFNHVKAVEEEGMKLEYLILPGGKHEKQ